MLSNWNYKFFKKIVNVSTTNLHNQRTFIKIFRTKDFEK